MVIILQLILLCGGSADGYRLLSVTGLIKQFKAQHADGLDTIRQSEFRKNNYFISEFILTLEVSTIIDFYPELRKVVLDVFI